MRTEAEKNVMIKGLEAMKENLPEFNAFGDNNHEKLNAQIRVIQEGLDEDDIYDEYDEEEDMELISDCITVINWLDGQDIADEILE